MDPVRPTDPSPASEIDAPTLDVPTSEALSAIRAKAEAALRGQRDLNSELEQRLEATLAELTETLAQESAAALDQQREEVAAERAQLEQDRAAWETERDAALQEISQNCEEASREADALAEKETELAQQQAELAEQSAALEELRAELQQNKEEVEALRASVASGADDAQRQLVENHQTELARLGESHTAETAELHSQLESTRKQIVSLQADLAAADENALQAEQTRRQLEQTQQELTAAKAALEQAPQQDHSQELAELQQRFEMAVAELQQRRDHSEQLAQELAQAQAALEQAAQQDGSEEIAELNRRFELAVSDAQQHRLRIDELEQELSERPTMDQGDSAEVVHLREQCDRLREQVADLENRPALVGNSSEDVEELQQRFEMAVEDVRELKRENQALQEQLASAAVGASSGDDSNDWEAQKRRLLASLEGESDAGGELPPERVEERATIQGTIQITDEVICGKDDVIADLKQKLAAVQENTNQELSNEFADDERFEAERARLRGLEDQLNEQLRQAELELSVGRATLARQKAELEQKLIDMESHRPTSPPQSNGRGEEGRRQSNWLKKLGLGGDDD